MDQRERFGDDEEALVAAIQGVLKHHHVVTVGIVAQDSDGRTLVAQPAIQRRDVAQDGTVSFVDHPLLLDVPLHHPGGGGVTHTFPIATGDEIISLIASRALDVWHQQGGPSAPMSTRTNSLSDAIAIPGLRSIPRQLEQISTSSAQVRDDAKLNVIDHAPGVGTTHFSADPSTPAASPSFDPLASATKFFRHIVQGAVGVIGSAVNGSTTHSHGVDHDQGAWMAAMTSAGTHFVRAHPLLGSLLSALDGQHTVTASSSGVDIQSATAVSIAAPPGGLSLSGLAAGGIGGAALGSGAAAQNVGALGGDLSGELPNPQVVSVLNVANAHLLPQAANDAAAAALTPPVEIGNLYRNGSALMVRVA